MEESGRLFWDDACLCVFPSGKEKTKPKQMLGREHCAVSSSGSCLSCMESSVWLARPIDMGAL